MNCVNCHERLPLSARSCFACGAPVRAEAGAPTSAPAYPRPACILRPTALRDRPYASARSIATLQPGEIATALSEQWGFIHLELPSGRRGFADQAAVAFDTAPPAAPQAVTILAPRSAMLPEPTPEHEATEISHEHPATPAQEPPTPPSIAGPSVGITGTPQTSKGASQISRGAGGAGTPAPVQPQPLPVSEAEQPAPEAAERPRRPRRAAGARKAAADAEVPEMQESGELPFGIPLLDGERVRYRAVFLYNPLDDQALVVTSRRLIVTGGTLGRLPRVLYLDEVEAVRLRDSGTGATNGEGNLFIMVSGSATPLHVGGIHAPHLVRNEILAACTDLQRARTRAAQRRSA